MSSINFLHGFLPETDPLQHLPEAFSVWEKTIKELPKLLISNSLLAQVKMLPPFPVNQLRSEAEYELAMVLLSFLGHAYVWGGKEPATKIIKEIAIPWYQVSKKLNRPPVLSYASYALHNWRRIDAKKPIELGNIALLQNFHGGMDEEWFVLVHVEIEAKAAVAINVLMAVQEAALNKNHVALMTHLKTIAETLGKICQTLDRMPEHCDPYIYYNRVRPYIHGWMDNSIYPNGIVYEGVDAYGGRPQKFRGETGAQSSIIPSLDWVLGITHQNDRLSSYLKEMRDYMPTQHRTFLKALESKPSIRDYVVEHAKKDSALRDIYNHCIELIARFRTTHLHYAAQYIQKQSQTSEANPTEVGTGGTPFMDYLRKHKEETLRFLVGS